MTTMNLYTDPRIIDTTNIPGQFVGIYTLRTFTGVLLNAGMDGKPKQITVGGARRLRISSQSLKRAMREWTHQGIADAEQAVRTTRLPEAVARRVVDATGRDYADTLAVVDALFLGAGKFTINAQTPGRTQEGVFAPVQTVSLLADITRGHWETLEPLAEPIRAALQQVAAETPDDSSAKPAAKRRGPARKAVTALPATVLPVALKKQVAAAFAPGASAEIALNGRMLTALPSTGAVEAASSVAHAFSVDPITLTTDDWTTKDEWQDGGFDDSSGTGASMLDTRTLSSGTIFQWAALDRRQLRINLADTSALEGDALEEAAQNAERLFVSSAAWAVPSAASHTTGSAVAPELAVATVGDQQPLMPPVYTSPIVEDVLVTAAARLGSYLKRAQAFSPINGGRILWMPGEDVALPEFPDVLTEGIR